MKYKIFISLIFLFFGHQAFALEWHDSLIEMLLKQPIRDKQMVVERDEKYLQIKRASYRFSFANSMLAKNIGQILFSHEKEALKFTSEDGEILMQVKEHPNTYYTFRLGKDPKIPGRYLLLISVKQGSFTKPENMSFYYDPDLNYQIELAQAIL